MIDKNKATIKNIREMTGPCRYCDKPVDWFCVDCWFGVCNSCGEEEAMEKCHGDCMDKVPFLGDIGIFPEK